MPAEVESRYESGFDSLTRFGLEKIGMDPNFVADYVNWETVRDHFDFTKVDQKLERHLVDTVGKVASKRAFEEAGKVVDRSLEVIAGVLGATGQWYGTAALILGEEALDWAEKKFEHYMGWTDADLPKKNHWVLINEGTRRRRLPGLLDSETGSKGKTGLDMSLARTMSHEHDGYMNVIDEKLRERNCRVESLLQITPEYEKKLEGNKYAEQMKNLAYQHPHGLAREVGEHVKSSIGTHISIDGQSGYTVVEGTTADHVVAEKGGDHVTRLWADDGVVTQWNANQYATTFRTSPDLMQDDFVTTGGFARGDWAWGGGELWVITAINGHSQVRGWSAYDARILDMQASDLEHFEGADYMPKIFKDFRNFAIKGWERQARANLPSNSFPEATTEKNAWRKFVPQQRRGKFPAVPDAPNIPDQHFHTPGLAKRIDESYQVYEQQAALQAQYENQPPPQKLALAWADTYSDVSMEAYQRWDRPNPPETSGVTFLPIVLGGLLVAFALTR